ncbi:MAG TPA: macro domain-containing protein [Gemmatimonadales bacterium]|nr:macro domain-containing protein [Gemmatimonadales bacterium]
MITVVVDDLASLQVDALLRPAGEALEPLTPAARRLDQLGGQRFAEQHRVTSPLEAGAAVVTGGGDLVAPFVIHAVIRDSRRPVATATVRRALVSAWQQAGAWELGRVAAPPVGADGGLGLEQAVALLVETFPGYGAHPTELWIVVERQEDREAVEAILRRSA